MDNNIRNSLKCQVANCGNVALGVFNSKWVCGECLIKIENKIREQQRKMFEIFEKEIEKENGGNTQTQ